MKQFTPKKSKNFDRNLNSSAMLKRISKNTWKGNEVLKQSANSIAPVLSGELRQDVSIIKRFSQGLLTVQVVWNKVYAKVRYFSNKTNPQTTLWIRKGHRRVASRLSKIQRDGVIK